MWQSMIVGHVAVLFNLKTGEAERRREFGAHDDRLALLAGDNRGRA